jgi:hypothetical protein
MKICLDASQVSRLHATDSTSNTTKRVWSQDDDIPGIVRYRTYEVLAAEVNNPRLRWAYLPYSMHMAGPREAIQHMIIRRNYG